MTCSICNRKFIKTKTQEEYVKERENLNKILDEIIDKLYDQDYNLCWDIVMKHESLLLFPGQDTRKCFNEKCNSKICSYCYNKKINSSPKSSFDNYVYQPELKTIIPFSYIPYCSLCIHNYVPKIRNVEHK